MRRLSSAVLFVPERARVRASVAFVTLAVACVVLAPSLALAAGAPSVPPGVDDLWTEFVLAIVRAALIVLHLPPINACPC